MLTRRELLAGLAATALPLPVSAQLVVPDRELRDPEQIVTYNRESGMRILDQRGQFVAARLVYYGPPVPFERLPRHLILALVASEDRRFFDNDYGIDFRGLARAAYQVVRGNTQGASTIPMQVVKEIYYKKHNPYVRKVEQIITAPRLSANLSKQEILFLYLNRVFFGRMAYGVEAAARTYFAKYAADLTLAESALLVQLLPNPAKFNPQRNVAEARRRALRVLGQMTEQGHISKATAAAAAKASVKLAPDLTYRRGFHPRGTHHGWFAVLAEQEAKQVADIGPGVQTVTTTLNTALQDTVQRILATALNQYGRSHQIGQGAVVVMTLSGDLMALVGGGDFRQTEFDHATRALRQPGSAFKPFVYLAALERGWRADDPVTDMPLALGGRTISNIDGQHRGEISMADALAYSSNPGSVRLAQGNVPATIALAKRLGITAALANQPTIALGLSEVTLLELTAAYAAIGNGGVAVQPSAVTTIRGNDGDLVYERADPRPRRVLRADHADLMRSMLARVIQVGTGRRADPGFWAAGKTGTTNDYRDALFVGFTDRHACGVWLGNERQIAMKGITGGSIPADIWKAVMVAARSST